MGFLRGLMMGMKALVNPDRRDRELDEELRGFLEASTAEKMRRGASYAEASRASRAEMGTRETVKEKVRSSHWESLAESVWQDLRYGLRQLYRSPGFSLTAILMLALGIGANTAIFTLVHAVMLKQLPIADPHQLYRIGEGEEYCCEWGGFEGSWGTFDYPYYKHLRDTNPAFEQVAAFSGGKHSYNVRRGGSTDAAQTIGGEYVSGNYFETLGVSANAGRLIVPADDRPESAATAVMSYRAWQGRFNASTSIIGSTILVNGIPVVLVGIAPQGFTGDRLDASPPDLWIPLNQEPAFEGEKQKALLNSQGDAWLYVIGRLRPGVLPVQLQAQLTADLQQWLKATRELSKDDLAELPKQHIAVTQGGAGISSFRSSSERGLYLLSGASLLVLLIACTNLANMLLARSAARQQQTALRVSLGASRIRLMRAMLTESVLLACIGGAAGLGLAYAGTKAIVLIAFRGATYMPVDATPSPAVLGFALGLSVLTGVLFGLAPAWLGTHADPAAGLRGSRTTTLASSRSQSTLIVVQAALSILLLAVAGLVTESLRNLEKTDFGFQTEGRLLANISFKAAGYEPGQLPGLYERLTQRLEAIPGVHSASVSLNSPQNLCCINLNVILGGRTEKWIEDVNVVYDRVSPHYFATIGTPLLQGRSIDDRDTQGSQHVAVVDEAFARKFFPNDTAIGKSFGLSLDGHGYDYQIVGVVKDAKYKNPAITASPTMFLPFTQTTNFKPTGYQRLETATLYAQSIELSVAGAPEQYEQTLRGALASIDPNLSLADLETYSEQVSIQFNQQRLIARLTGLFSALSLVLASVGLYGVTAYNVARRTNEIGTRMALGASRGDIVLMVLRRVLLQVGLGIGIGLPMAVMAERYLAHQLYEVSRLDLMVLSSATGMLCACALLAGLVPARRAASIEPMTALRSE